MDYISDCCIWRQVRMFGYIHEITPPGDFVFPQIETLNFDASRLGALHSCNYFEQRALAGPVGSENERQSSATFKRDTMKHTPSSSIRKFDITQQNHNELHAEVSPAFS